MQFALGFFQPGYFPFLFFQFVLCLPDILLLLLEVVNFAPDFLRFPLLVGFQVAVDYPFDGLDSTQGQPVPVEVQTDHCCILLKQLRIHFLVFLADVVIGQFDMPQLGELVQVLQHLVETLVRHLAA